MSPHSIGPRCISFSFLSLPRTRDMLVMAEAILPLVWDKLNMIMQRSKLIVTTAMAQNVDRGLAIPAPKVSFGFRRTGLPMAYQGTLAKPNVWGGVLRPLCIAFAADNLGKQKITTPDLALTAVRANNTKMFLCANSPKGKEHWKKRYSLQRNQDGHN